MKTRWTVAVLAALPLVAAAQAPRPSVDAAFEAFWSAAGAVEAAARTGDIVRSGISFDDAYKRLAEGRAYRPQPAGVVRLTHRTSNGVEHPYGVDVPKGYDHTRTYRARIQLHGGVMMRHDNHPPPTAGGIGTLAGDDPQIYIVPFAWDAAPWWSNDQLHNIAETLDAAKRRYNIDENQVVLSGVSDGGTGAYYVAMRETTPFAAFLPLNGYWGVLANHDLQIDGPLYPGNLRNKPFFIVNGERDPLYPTAIVEPAIAHYKQLGIEVEYHPQAGAGHNTQWWPQVKEDYEAFEREHGRQPLPDTLTWETAETAAFNRAHWLIVNRLGDGLGQSTLDDPNLVASPPRLEFGVRSVGNRINRVVPGSNAERLGLKAGDALVRLNGESAGVRLDIEELFAQIEPGSPITLLVARDNAPLELSGTYEPATVTDPPHAFFDIGVRSGRVDLVRKGNTVTAKTRGVSAFTLLLSPDQFDFDKPVTVIVNGRTLLNRRVERNLTTLLKWAAADNDRTMLFAAEIKIGS
jgi:hypothetical protein